MTAIADLITANRTLPRYIQLLRIIAELRYADFNTLKSVKNPLTQTMATKTVLTGLLNAGYLELTDNQAYSTTVKSLDFLKKQGINTKHCQKRHRGEYDQHQALLSRCLLPLMFEKDYYAVFYPKFKKPPDYIERLVEPDACLIRRNGTGYKIEFIEVENSQKPKGYLQEKKTNYERVAQDGKTYFDWWSYHSKQLELPMCRVDDFCFSVQCVGDLRANWPGWSFKEPL